MEHEPLYATMPAPIFAGWLDRHEVALTLSSDHRAVHITPRDKIQGEVAQGLIRQHLRYLLALAASRHIMRRLHEHGLSLQQCRYAMPSSAKHMSYGDETPLEEVRGQVADWVEAWERWIVGEVSPRKTVMI